MSRVRTMVDTRTASRPQARAWWGTWAMLFALLLALLAADRGARAAAPSAVAGQAAPEQAGFPSAEAASQALLDVVRSENEPALRRLLGGPDDLFNPDPAAAREERQLFVQKYTQMHRLQKQTDGSLVLYVGAENWPFPVPLVQRDGRWRFDAEAGLREVLYRRVGENEITAIETCRALASVDAHDAAAGGKAGDPVDGLVSEVRATATSGKPARFHGYDFLMVKPGPAGKPGGQVAAVAWPAEYRSSGVMTFIVRRDGSVYQKDLGAHSAQAARKLAGASPRLDRSWTRAQAE